MYKRQKGDDLLSKDPRLKYKWIWLRGGSDIEREELNRWTHFQVSHTKFYGWELQAIQWDAGYEAVINYNNERIASIGNHLDTRILAQVEAEKLLRLWIQVQYDMIHK